MKLFKDGQVSDGPSTPPLEELMEFPSAFTFCVIANDTPSLIQDCQRMVERILDRPAIQVTNRPSRDVHYRAVKVTAMVLTADEVRAVYAELKLVPDLRLLL